MRLWSAEALPPMPPLQLAVVGHVEWVTFLAVDSLPAAGQIGHSHRELKEPAGGGAVVAVQLARLLGRPVPFFTSLGRDAIGERAAHRLAELGLDLHVGWRDRPTRRAISYVDGHGDRSITVIGDRLMPVAADPLPWERLASCDGAFVTAADAAALARCRAASVLAVTPRLGVPLLQRAAIPIDALIGSGLDPGERVPEGVLDHLPSLRIATEGADGGVAIPGGRFAAPTLTAAAVDSYGCGDSFTAGAIAGLAAGWTVEQAVSLGCHCGAACISRFGPYG